jgi:hypothetical protein
LRAVVLASKTGLRAAHERITSESARTLAVAEDVSALRASVASLNVTLLAVEKTLDAGLIVVLFLVCCFMCCCF